jgi:hypothetical protein
MVLIPYEQKPRKLNGRRKRYRRQNMRRKRHDTDQDRLPPNQIKTTAKLKLQQHPKGGT